MLSACRRFGSSKPNPAVIPGREQGEPGGLRLVNIIDNIIDRHTRAGGYPVRRGFSAPLQAPWNTGSSAFADDDGCKRGSRTHSTIGTCLAALRRAGAPQVGNSRPKARSGMTKGKRAPA